MLTAGVDVQDDRFEVEVVGWGIGKESWGIRYQKIYGDMLKEQVWQDLDNFLLGASRKRRDGAAHHERLHRHRRAPHRSGIPLHGGTVGAENMVDQGQGRRGRAIYPKSHHQQPW